MKLLYITCVFLFTAGNSFGQASHANISATIVTPVGAEFSGDINDGSLFSKSTGKQADLKIEKEKATSFLKIIGEVFSHYTTVENDQVMVKRNENEEVLPVSKQQPVVRITINFD